MLRVIEFVLLGVSLVVIVGLIVSGARDHSESHGANPSELPNDQRGKTR